MRLRFVVLCVDCTPFGCGTCVESGNFIVGRICRRYRTNAFSFLAFCRKYPDGRTRIASLDGRAAAMAEGVSICAERRLAIARSTFAHEVFWVRMAPTITSNGVFAGHQCIGPRA